MLQQVAHKATVGFKQLIMHSQTWNGIPTYYNSQSLWVWFGFVSSRKVPLLRFVAAYKYERLCTQKLQWNFFLLQYSQKLREIP